MEQRSSTPAPAIWRIGNATIEKVWETDLDGMTFRQLLPDFDDHILQRHPDWIPAGTSDGDGHALLSVHAWLVRHEGRTILIDTGAGNDKSRPQQPALDGLANPFLERLRAAGVAPEDIDFVVHTHIHSDHVGWDTQLVDGEWQPTFPNAKIIVSGLEYAYGAALNDGDNPAIQAARRQAGLGDPVRVPVAGTFADSIRPVARRGLIRQVLIDETEVLPGIRFLPTPGHSIDHASIELTSGGQVALFSGDVFHHPVEVRAVDLVSVFCEFPEATRRSRRWFLDHAVRSDASVFTSHFPGTSVGKVKRSPDGYLWTIG